MWLGNISVAAHETGTTHVTATLRKDHSVEIEIRTDADALLEKLESAAGEGAGRPGEPSAIAARLQRLDEVIRSRAPQHPHRRAHEAAAQYSVVQAGSDPPLAIVTMRSQTPASTGGLTWKFGWTFTIYTFDAYLEGTGLTVTKQLEGNEESVLLSAGTVVAGSADKSRPGTIIGWNVAGGWPFGSGRVLTLVFLCLTYGLFELLMSKGGSGRTVER